MTDRSPEPCDILWVLEEDGAITPANRMVLERFVQTWGVSAPRAITLTNVLSEAELANALAKVLDIDRGYDVAVMQLLEESVDVLPFRRAREWECLVVRGDAGAAHLVMADPTRVDRINEIKQGLARELSLSVGERSDIVRAIDELYPLSAQLPSLHKSCKE